MLQVNFEHLLHLLELAWGCSPCLCYGFDDSLVAIRNLGTLATESGLNQCMVDIQFVSFKTRNRMHVGMHEASASRASWSKCVQSIE